MQKSLRIDLVKHWHFVEHLLRVAWNLVIFWSIELQNKHTWHYFDPRCNICLYTWLSNFILVISYNVAMLLFPSRVNIRFLLQTKKLIKPMAHCLLNHRLPSLTVNKAFALNFFDVKQLRNLVYFLILRNHLSWLSWCKRAIETFINDHLLLHLLLLHLVRLLNRSNCISDPWQENLIKLA
jgi:hypothetical protein